jgi:transmembrane sensor
VRFPLSHAGDDRRGFALNLEPTDENTLRRSPWAVCASLLVLLALPYAVEGLRAAPVTYSAGIGQRIFLPLEDGSTVELNTRTRIEVEFTSRERDVRLLSGEAVFDVHHDPSRPFRVVSGSTTIQDVGTRFDVERQAQGTTTVTVVEGRVQVGASGRTATVEADEVATVGTEGGAALRIELASVSHPEIERRLSWQTGVLRFQGQTLAEAVIEVNRYNARQLVIADPSIARLQLGGTCRGVDLESFVALLQVLFPVRAVPAPDDPNVIELKRSPAAR